MLNEKRIKSAVNDVDVAKVETSFKCRIVTSRYC